MPFSIIADTLAALKSTPGCYHRVYFCGRIPCTVCPYLRQERPRSLLLVPLLRRHNLPSGQGLRGAFRRHELNIGTERNSVACVDRRDKIAATLSGVSLTSGGAPVYNTRCRLPLHWLVRCRCDHAKSPDDTRYSFASECLFSLRTCCITSITKSIQPYAVPCMGRGAPLEDMKLTDHRDCDCAAQYSRPGKMDNFYLALDQ